MAKYLLSNWISIVALIISFITLLKTRKTLEVTFENDCSTITAINSTDFCIDFENTIYCYYIKVVNPSSHNIGFFDLIAYDPDNGNTILEIVNGLKLEYTGVNPLYGALNEYGQQMNLNLPYSNYGVFPSNSFQRLEILVSPNPNCKRVAIRFKVAIKSFTPVKNTSDRRFYKHYTKVYSLNTTSNSHNESPMS